MPSGSASGAVMGDSDSWTAGHDTARYRQQPGYPWPACRVSASSDLQTGSSICERKPLVGTCRLAAPTRNLRTSD